MATKYLHNTSYDDRFPWRPSFYWDRCSACFERFDFTACNHCGNGHEEMNKGKSQRVVAFINGQPLLLSGIERDNGAICKGFVENGLWYLTIRNNVVGASGTDNESYKPLREWKLETITEIEVPEKMRGNYDSVITWAEKQLA